MSRLRFWGPFSTLGLAVAALSFGLDQTVKWFLLRVLDLEARGEIYLTPLLSLRMMWNHGVSYGFLTTHTQGLLIGVSLAITVALLIWLAGVQRALTAAALGLVIGGALSNALDRLVHGAVADFLYFPLLQGLHFALFDFIFNPADVAIVAGVGLLLYESIFESKARGGH